MIAHIVLDIVAPIFVLMGVGVLMDRLFRLDLPTLSKLNFHVFVPALVFVKLLDSRLDARLIHAVTAFNLIHLLALWGLAHAVFSLPKFRRERSVLTLATLFNNSGNYGLPFAQMAFGAFGVEIMALILIFQNVASFSLGLWLIAGGRSTWRQQLRDVLTAPALWAVALALPLNAGRVPLPPCALFPLQQLGAALIPVALMTLGAQLSRTSWAGQFAPLSAVTVARLIVAPLVAVALVRAWQLVFPGQLAAAAPILICAASLPVAVNVYILAMEYDHQPELASRMVFWTTLLSAVTLTVWLAVCMA